MGQLEPLDGRCNAKLKNPDNRGNVYCPNYPVSHSTRCRMHGGATPRGIGSPHWRTGARSQALPDRLAQQVHEYLDDPDITSMLHDIAVTDARMGELYTQFTTGEAGAAWASARQVQANLMRLLAPVPKPDEDKTPAELRSGGVFYVKISAQVMEGLQKSLLEQVAALDAAINTGSHERSLFNEIFSLQQHRAKLVQTELKREARLEQNVTAKQALTLIGVLKQILFEVVTEPAKRLYVANRLERLINKQSTGALSAGAKDADFEEE